MGNYRKLIRRATLAGLLLLLAALCHQLVVGAGGLLENHKLNREFAEQQLRNKALRQRNEAARDWLEQSQQPEAIEAHARSELGMVRRGEMLFWVVDDTAKSAQENTVREDGVEQ